MSSPLASRYRVLEKIGEGSMGIVHRGLALDDGRPVAIKFLAPELADDPETVARLAREAQATTAVAHPNIARAIELGAEPDGRPWLVMEYIEGQSLRDVLRGGALPPARALAIARAVLSALDAAHGAGVIHRDIKPENVMLTADERGSGEGVKVLDFGIAKLDGRHALTGPSTNAGVIFGTPTYMAPEQVRREALDARVDLYALGIMLFEMIAGAVPFDGDDLTVLARHLTLPPPPLSSAHPLTLAVRSFVARLLAKKRDGRPASAQAALAELDEALGSLDTAGLESTALRTGATHLPPNSLPNSPTHVPPSADPWNSLRPASPPPSTTAPAAAHRSYIQRKTAKLQAFARSYGLTPQQLVVGFAVAFGLVLLVMVVAVAGG